MMYAAAAGLPNPSKWAAIGMAESGGRTNVVNGIGATGWLQINQPVHVRRHPKWTKKWLKNPLNNARAAKAIFDEQGWSAWQAYTGPDGSGSDGPWRRHYRSGAVVPAGAWDDFWDGFKDGFDIGPGPEDFWDDDGFSDDEWEGDYVGPLDDIAEFTAKAGNWVSNRRNWIRVAYVVGGGILAIVGSAMVIRGTALRQVTGAVAKAAKRTSAGRKQGRSRGNA